MGIKFGSWMVDKKIKGINVNIEMTIGEYWEIAPNILDKNEFQRKRVRTTGKTYQLLAKDLLDGCIMPPLILALSDKESAPLKNVINSCVDAGCVTDRDREVLTIALEQAFEKDNLLILDGLQRTYTIGDCIATAKRDPERDLQTFLEKVIRAEVYVGLSKQGILYRMITLNTGQSPMSLRHQIEMLYQDYIDNEQLRAIGIDIYRESAGFFSKGVSHYRFSDVADMYYAYTVGNPASHSKQTITNTLQEQDFLEEFSADKTADLFSLVKAYNEFSLAVHRCSDDWEFARRVYRDEGNGLLDPIDEDSGLAEELSKITTPFGDNVSSVLSKSQIMSGFGAACHHFIHRHVYSDVLEIENVLAQLQISKADCRYGLDLLITFLEEIKGDAKRVGDAQRAYFLLFFKHFLNPEHEKYLRFSDAVISSKTSHESMF